MIAEDGGCCRAKRPLTRNIDALCSKKTCVYNPQEHRVWNHLDVHTS